MGLTLLKGDERPVLLIEGLFPSACLTFIASTMFSLLWKSHQFSLSVAKHAEMFNQCIASVLLLYYTGHFNVFILCIMKILSKIP